MVVICSSYRLTLPMIRTHRIICSVVWNLQLPNYIR